ncbi:MAG TPA: agglutinin biogenesis protein MshN, partial [Pseudoalteromonas sp.]|nr:agglutinin biogenesis protein MshN [Pseudoalteromonas sp.]
ILQTQPEHIEARNLLAATYFQQQDVLMAQQLLVAGIKINPEVVQWRVMLSKILIMQQEYEGVLKLLITELEPQANLEFWVLKGTAAQNAQQHQIALASFTQLTQLQPQQAKWWLALATSKDALGEFADAKHLYKVALDLGGLNAAMTQHALQRLVALKEAV